MTLTYIFHSGFALETDDALIIFDYWMDPARVVPRLLCGAKRVYVFASHFHEDHFTRDILQWRSEYPSAIFTYILSKDILRHRRAQRDEADVWMGKGAEWSDGYLHVVATGSNDSGVSWIVEVEGRRIFHAGDLNNWYARFLASDTPGSIIRSTEFGIDVNPLAEEKRYLGELKDIRRALIKLESDVAKTPSILDFSPSKTREARIVVGGETDFDLVMFPIDGRIGNGYTRGARQFVKQFSVRHFAPMHFVAAGFESAWRMEEYVQPPSRFWRISKEGDTYNII
ncbi:MAG: MBL fold metallo-hydrolase [Bacteroidales bacterium]|nr:MBL fold metallo-hydrolase [Bacteroidales bacterium]